MEGFRQKSDEELKDQISSVTEILGVDVAQPSTESEISKQPLEEIKAKYPERYDPYLKILRAQKNNQEIDSGELVEMREWISSLNNLDSYIAKHAPQYETFEVRDKRQFDVFEDIRDSLEQGEKEGYIKLPTGVGKTVLFSRVVESLGLKTLVVVPSKILVKQTGERFEEFTDIEFGKFFQGEKNLSENVTVTTYNSLVKGVKNGAINPDEYHALILDEAHKALGEETSKAVRQFKGVKLGFTATPKFSEDKHVSDLLEHEIHSMGIVEAAQEGLISRFKSYVAYTDTDLSKVEVKNREKYDENELEKAIDHEGRNQSAVELYKKEFDGQLAIAYCGGVTHAKHVSELFNASGISAEIISGDTPDDEGSNSKEAILERFRNGETKVLCNARILIEGFDEPKASVCLNLQPTLSLVDAEQRAGRVLRIDPENPEKWAYIVDFIDHEPRVAPRTFAEIAEASEVDGERAVTFGTNRIGSTTGIESGERDRIANLEITGLRVFTDTQEVMSIVSNIMESRYEIAPDGWLNTFSVAKKTNRTFVTVRRAAYKHRESHPEWFKEYRSASKGRVYEYFAPELIEIISETLTNVENAPDGWMTATQLKGEFGGGVTKVQRIANFYRQENPEWFSFYLDKRNIPYEYFSPELVRIIRENLGSIEEAPEGWIIPARMIKLINISLPKIKSTAGAYRSSHPEWFKVYSSQDSKPTEHYSPELVDELKKIFEKEVEIQAKGAPEGWGMISQLQDEFGGGYKKFQKIAEMYRDEHPDWFKTYPDQRKNLREFIAPELVQIMRERFKGESIPEGWVKVSEIIKESKFSSNKIRKLLEKYKLLNPDSFKEYKDSSGRVFEHVSPDIFEKISIDSNQYESAPTGWLTLGSLSRQMNEDQKTISKRANKYRESHPEYFQKYLDGGGRAYEHYSPELIPQLVKMISSLEDAPEGWMYNNSVATKLNKKRDRVKEVAYSFRDSHPEWFKTYREKRGREVEHFSPELVSEIEKVLVKSKS